MADDEYSILNTQCQYELSYMEMTELFQVPTIHSSDQKTLELLANIKYFYENCLFCDVKLVAGNADHNFNSVPCHSLVIVSAIPRLLHIFESAFEVCSFLKIKLANIKPIGLYHLGLYVIFAFRMWKTFAGFIYQNFHTTN